MSAEKDAPRQEWREDIGERVMRAMSCCHIFEGAICEICWGNTQRVCSLIERDNDALVSAVAPLLAAIDRAARLSGRAAEHPEALSIRAEADRVRAVLTTRVLPPGSSDQ